MPSPDVSRLCTRMNTGTGLSCLQLATAASCRSACRCSSARRGRTRPRTDTSGLWSTVVSTRMVTGSFCEAVLAASPSAARPSAMMARRRRIASSQRRLRSKKHSTAEFAESAEPINTSSGLGGLRGERPRRSAVRCCEAPVRNTHLRLVGSSTVTAVIGRSFGVEEPRAEVRGAAGVDDGGPNRRCGPCFSVSRFDTPSSMTVWRSL